MVGRTLGALVSSRDGGSPRRVEKRGQLSVDDHDNMESGGDGTVGEVRGNRYYRWWEVVDCGEVPGGQVGGLWRVEKRLVGPRPDFVQGNAFSTRLAPSL